MTSAKRIRELIRAHATGVRADEIRTMPHPGWGGDSDAYLVDGDWIFRFPRTANVARNLAVEIALLPILASVLPLRIPAFAYVVHGENGLPSFVGYRAIPGEPLQREQLAALNRDAVERVGAQLGAFLAALHRFPVDAAIRGGVTPPAESPSELLDARFARVRDRIFPVLEADERRWVGERFAAFRAIPGALDYVPTLNHGDFSADHVLFDPASRQLTGVIDFGDLTIGDPAGEFTWRADYGHDFFQAVLRHYAAPRDEGFVARVQFRIDCLPLSQIGYGVETGNARDVEEGRAALRQRIRDG